MKGLLAGTSKTLNAILSTKLGSRASILKASKKAAEDASTSGNIIKPEIKTNPDAQEEADRINMFRLRLSAPRKVSPRESEK